MNQKPIQNLLISRPDRMGDVILTTPCFEALKCAHPNARITVLVRPMVAPLLESHPFVDEVLVWDFREAALWAGAKQLKRVFESRQFDALVAFQSNPQIALAAFLARIPVRVGPLSKPHSYFLYNQGKKQSRSLVKMHEAEYNLDLLEHFLERPLSELGPLKTRISIPDAAQKWAKGFFEAAGFLSTDAPIIGVHPGMGGSAFNWSASNYVDLVSRLLSSEKKVFMSFGPMDRTLFESEFESLSKAYPSRLLTYRSWECADRNRVTDLGALYQHVDAFFAPSTGPLHLANALGKPVVSIYPKNRVQSAKRWGPYPANERQIVFEAPEIAENLDAIMVDTVVNGIQSALEIRARAQEQGETTNGPELKS